MPVRTTIAALSASVLLGSGLALAATTTAQAAPAPAAYAASTCSEARAELKKATARLDDAGNYRAAKQDEVSYWRTKRNDAKLGSPAWKNASVNLRRAQGELQTANSQYAKAQNDDDRARAEVNASC